MRVIVTGATQWTDAEAIRRELAQLPPGSIIIYGDAPGVDALAGTLAVECGLTALPFRKDEEDYRRYGHAAWKGLNERMLESGADLVLAFHPELGVPGKAKGSGHMIALAEQRGIEVRRFS